MFGSVSMNLRGLGLGTEGAFKAPLGNTATPDKWFGWPS